MPHPAWLIEGDHPVPYGLANDSMHRLAERRLADEVPDSVILLEHPPVFTAGRRAKPEHLVWIPDPRPAARGGGGTPLQKTPPAPAPVVTAPQPATAVVEPETIRPEPEPQIVATDAPAAAPPTTENAKGQNAGTGTTDGPGRGPDTGPGNGGTIYGVGNGVTAPSAGRKKQNTRIARPAAVAVAAANLLSVLSLKY